MRLTADTTISSSSSSSSPAESLCPPHWGARWPQAWLTGCFCTNSRKVVLLSMCGGKWKQPPRQEGSNPGGRRERRPAWYLAALLFQAGLGFRKIRHFSLVISPASCTANSELTEGRVLSFLIWNKKKINKKGKNTFYSDLKVRTNGRRGYTLLTNVAKFSFAIPFFSPSVTWDHSDSAKQNSLDSKTH